MDAKLQLLKVRSMMGKWWEYRGSFDTPLHFIVFGYVSDNNGGYDLKTYYKGGPRPDEWGFGYLSVRSTFRELSPHEVGVGVHQE